MLRRALQLAEWVPAVVAGALGITIMVLSVPGWAGLILPLLAPPPSGVVQNYVLFTHVPDGNLTVTTGTQFVSTTDRKIDHQWCYIERDAAAAGDLLPKIALADSAGAVAYPTLSASTLSALQLASDEVRGIADRHCRFLK